MVVTTGLYRECSKKSLWYVEMNIFIFYLTKCIWSTEAKLGLGYFGNPHQEGIF